MDDIDRAQELEERHRQAAIDAHFARNAPPVFLGVDLCRCCKDCETPIGEARLRAVPHAQRCVECAERVERRFRGT